MLIPETPQPPSASFGRATINRISPTGTGTPLVRASGYLNIFCEGLERFPGCWDLFHFLKEEEVKVSLREVRDELNKRAPADLIRPWYARGKNRYYPEDHDRVSILVPLALVGTITYPYKWAVSCLSGHALPVTNPCVPRHFARTLQSNVRFSSPSILGVKVFEVTLNLCFAVDRRDYKTAFKLFADLDQLLNAYEGGPAMTPPIGKWYDGVKRILTYLERDTKADAIHSVRNSYSSIFPSRFKELTGCSPEENMLVKGGFGYDAATKLISVHSSSKVIDRRPTYPHEITATCQLVMDLQRNVPMRCFHLE